MKRKLERVLLGAIIALIAFVIIAYTRGETPETNAQPTATIGDTVTVNDVIYEVDSVREAAEYNGKTTENKFVIVTLSAANNGKEEAHVYSELFRLHDDEDREYKGEVQRDSGNANGYFGYGDEVEAGLKKTGEVAFEVPASSAGYTFAISDNMVETSSTKYVYVDLR